LVLFACAAIVTLAGLAWRALRQDRRSLRAWLSARAALVFILALSVPVGEAIVSAVSTQIFGVRNLAASWPFLALACAAMIVWAGPRVRLVAAPLAVLAFLLGAAKMVTTRFSRPDVLAAARFVEQQARAGDVVIDSTGVLSPGPLTSLDLVLRARGPVIRAAAPQEREHPYGLLDPVTPLPLAARDAVAAAHGRRIFLVTFVRAASPIGPFSSTYRLSAVQVYKDFIPITVEVWASRVASGT
ncbi:MAG: hypothetical protein M3Z95_02300, partial [Actinomycetota bacterium]|nr:hypothetical protein [Actinomycetota bacterium]